MKCLRCGMPRKFLQEGSTNEICINGFPTHKWKGKMSTNKKLAEGGKAYEKEFIAHELCREEIAHLKDLLLLKRKIIKRLRAELHDYKLAAKTEARMVDNLQHSNEKLRAIVLKKKELRSDCHYAPVYVASSDEGTSHYICAECSKDCNIAEVKK